MATKYNTSSVYDNADDENPNNNCLDRIVGGEGGGIQLIPMGEPRQEGESRGSRVHGGGLQSNLSAPNLLLRGTRKACQPPRRRVTFVGEVIRCPHDPDFIIDVIDEVTFYDIPNTSNYTPEEKRKIWYTKEEKIQMKQLCIHTARQATSPHHYNTSLRVSVEQEALYCRFFFLRRLERFLDYYQRVDTNEDATNSRTSGCCLHHCGKRNRRIALDNTSSVEEGRNSTITAVLLEQYQQQMDGVRKYGTLLSTTTTTGTGSVLLDMEKVRAVYQANGQTTTALQHAQYFAALDAQHVEDYCRWNNDTEEQEETPHFVWVNESSSPSSTATTSTRTSIQDPPKGDRTNENETDDKHPHYDPLSPHNHKNNKNTNTMLCCATKPLLLFDCLGVHTLLHRIIKPCHSPLIEVRGQGDLFVGIEQLEYCLL